jgi:hypothetical protein
MPHSTQIFVLGGSGWLQLGQVGPPIGIAFIGAGAGRAASVMNFSV